MLDVLPFILFLMILAVFLRAESALTIFYLILGTFLLGLWWNKRALKHVHVTRKYDDHAYLMGQVPVELMIENKSLLPILWLEIHESLPVNLRAGVSVKHVFSLGIRGKKTIAYDLMAFKRGYHPIGPALISSGDPLGLVQPNQKAYPSDSLTIYPKIVRMESLGLPSRSPFGTLKHHNPVFEDPSRTIGKRDFQSGDSIRRIDWKSTAATGKLQVKLYEASIALDVALLLDLHRDNYDIKTFFDATELSIITAASLAAWGKFHQQSVGLATNGVDPLNDNRHPKPLPPQKGTGHFINILENLARIQPSSSLPITSLLQKARAELSWGTTLVVITGRIDKTLLSQLFQTRKAGFNPVVILSGHTGDLSEERLLAENYHIPLHAIAYHQDLTTIGAP